MNQFSGHPFSYHQSVLPQRNPVPKKKYLEMELHHIPKIPVRYQGNNQIPL